MHGIMVLMKKLTSCRFVVGVETLTFEFGLTGTIKIDCVSHEALYKKPQQMPYIMRDPNPA
jgi:hypothetical protein